MLGCLFCCDDMLLQCTDSLFALQNILNQTEEGNDQIKVWNICCESFANQH